MGIVNHVHVLIEKQTRLGRSGCVTPVDRLKMLPHVKNSLFCNVPGERILGDVADDTPDIRVVPMLTASALCSVSIYL